MLTNDRQSQAIAGNRRQSQAIAGNGRQSQAIAANRRQSQAIADNRRQSQADKLPGGVRPGGYKCSLGSLRGYKTVLPNGSDLSWTYFRRPRKVNQGNTKIRSVQFIILIID